MSYAVTMNGAEIKLNHEDVSALDEPVITLLDAVFQLGAALQWGRLDGEEVYVYIDVDSFDADDLVRFVVDADIDDLNVFVNGVEV